MAEPIFVYFDDCAPKGHAFAEQQTVHCIDCRNMVLCLDEVMRAFFITGVGAMCLRCFFKRYEGQDNLAFDELELP